MRRVFLIFISGSTHKQNIEFFHWLKKDDEHPRIDKRNLPKIEENKKLCFQYLMRNAHKKNPTWWQLYNINVEGKWIMKQKDEDKEEEEEERQTWSKIWVDRWAIYLSIERQKWWYGDDSTWWWWWWWFYNMAGRAEAHLPIYICVLYLLLYIKIISLFIERNHCKLIWQRERAEEH